jgi:hypothetical protein
LQPGESAFENERLANIQRKPGEPRPQAYNPSARTPAEPESRKRGEWSDYADALPSEPRAKLMSLRRARAAAAALRSAAGDGETKERRRLVNLQARKRQLEEWRGPAKNTGEITEVEAELALVQQDVADAAALVETASAKAQNLGGIVRAVEEYVEDQVKLGARFEVVAVKMPKVTNAGAYYAAVDKARGEVESLKAQIAEVKAAPVPSAEVKRDAARMVEALASTAAPDCLAAIEGRGEIRFPVVQTWAAGAIGDALKNQRDPLALLAWLFPEAMVAKLHAAVDVVADDSRALSDRDRASRLEKLAAQLDEAERTDEALVANAALNGVDIARRGDASPEAVLGVRAVAVRQ